MDRRLTLLIVEDEDVLRTLVAQFLRNEGFEVREARDGGEGVQAFHDHGPFDLMLVDIKMPVFNGVEVCRRVKLVAPDQPMMVCSAAIVREHEEALNAVGVTHFLTKPYHPEALIATSARRSAGRPRRCRPLPRSSPRPGRPERRSRQPSAHVDFPGEGRTDGPAGRRPAPSRIRRSLAKRLALN